MKLPEAITESLVVNYLNNETIIYKLGSNQVFCLNETSAKVFSACDGKQTFADLKAKHKFSDDLIYLALDELKANDLLAGSYNSPAAGMNRRELIKKVGLASVIAMPLISGIIAPTAADAQSGIPIGQCAPGQVLIDGGCGGTL